jgi:hypothetical protein
LVPSHRAFVDRGNDHRAASALIERTSGTQQPAQSLSAARRGRSIVDRPAARVCLQNNRASRGDENMSVPKNYRTIEEFEREELRPQYKVGFSLEDLMQETIFEGSDMLFDDTVDEYDPDQQDDEDD